MNATALSTLRSFNAAAHLESFTRAAAELHITQSAVSQHVKALEDRLACKLFFRLPGQIKLTNDGKRFAEVVSRALKDLAEAAETLATPRNFRVHVRLHASPSFALHWLIPRLGRLKLQHPQITPHLVGDEHYIESPRNNFDLAIELTQAPSPDMLAEFLMDEYLTPVCSPEYLSKHPFLRTPAAFAHCTLLHDLRPWRSAAEDAEWRYWLDHAGAHGVDSRKGQYFTSSAMAIEAAVAHQGVALGHFSLLEVPIAARLLVAPLAHPIKSPLRYYLSCPRDLSSRAGVTELAKWLRDEAQDASDAYLRPPLVDNLSSDGCNYTSAPPYPTVLSCNAFSRAGAASARITST